MADIAGLRDFAGRFSGPQVANILVAAGFVAILGIMLGLLKRRK